VPYDATSWESFRAHAASLDYVAPQWVTIDACGQISSQDDRTLVSHARQHGVRVLPSLLTSQRWLNHRLLTDEPTRDLAVQQIAQYVLSEGYDGIDLDLEDVAPEDRQAYTEFVRRVAGALHQAGLTLAVAVPAKTSDVTTGWAGAYDYAALGRTADLMLVMAYAYTTSSSAPGSTAPYQWVDKVAEFAASQVPREKLLLGVAAYGYDWNVSVGGRATSLTNEAARRVAGHYGAAIGIDPASRSATFRYEVVAGRPTPVAARPTPFQHDITYRRPAAACAYPTPTIAPRPTVTPGATPARPAPTLTPPAVQKHIVWLEDAASVSARLEIARARMIGGAGIWRLGQEDPAVWPALDAFRSR
jgi:spore germination protein YaaH